MAKNKEGRALVEVVTLGDMQVAKLIARARIAIAQRNIESMARGLSTDDHGAWVRGLAIIGEDTGGLGAAIG